MYKIPSILFQKDLLDRFSFIKFRINKQEMNNLKLFNIVDESVINYSRNIKIYSNTLRKMKSF